MPNTATLHRFPGAASHQPAPLRMLRALFHRLRNAGTNPMALDIAEHQISREEAAIAAGVRGAKRLVTRIDSHRAEIAAYLTDKKSPGIIDADEARQLTRHLITTGQAASAHATQLETLQ